jgi:hypothetical protein
MTIYPKLLPLQVTGANSGPVEINVTDDQRARALAAYLARRKPNGKAHEIQRPAQSRSHE